MRTSNFSYLIASSLPTLSLFYGLPHAPTYLATTMSGGSRQGPNPTKMCAQAKDNAANATRLFKQYLLPSQVTLPAREVGSSVASAKSCSRPYPIGAGIRPPRITTQ